MLGRQHGRLGHVEIYGSATSPPCRLWRTMRDFLPARFV
jgi:hypothetical protein